MYCDGTPGGIMPWEESTLSCGRSVSCGIFIFIFPRGKLLANHREKRKQRRVIPPLSSLSYMSLLNPSTPSQWVNTATTPASVSDTSQASSYFAAGRRRISPFLREERAKSKSSFFQTYLPSLCSLPAIGRVLPLQSPDMNRDWPRGTMSALCCHGM